MPGLILSPTWSVGLVELSAQPTTDGRASQHILVSLCLEGSIGVSKQLFLSYSSGLILRISHDDFLCFNGHTLLCCE